MLVLGVALLTIGLLSAVALWRLSVSSAADAGPATASSRSPSAVASGPAFPSATAAPTRPSTAPPTSGRPRGAPSVPEPATFGWPDAASTGVPPGTKLVKKTNQHYIVTTPGTVINGWDLPGVIEIKANNVTIKNSRIRCFDGDTCVSQSNGFKGLHLDHDDIGLDSGWGNVPVGVELFGTENKASAVNNNILEYLHIHNVGDGVRPDGNFTLRYSYIHALDITNDAAHSDGVQTFGGSYVLIYHNTIEGGNTSDILVQGGGSNFWVIDDNLLLGRRAPDGITSFAIGFDRNSCPGGGCMFVNNHVNRTWQVDVSYDAGPWNSGNWYHNVYQDNGATVPVPN